VPNKSTFQHLVERFREAESIGEKRRSCRPSVISNDSFYECRCYNVAIVMLLKVFGSYGIIFINMCFKTISILMLL
jgi:hypothetical protein